MPTNSPEYQREYQREYRKTHPQKQYRKRNYLLERLHLRIRELKTKQKYCSICNETKKLVLSNIDGNYSEDPNDYWWLCYECHNLYDRENKTHTKKVKNIEVKKVKVLDLIPPRAPVKVEKSVSKSAYVDKLNCEPYMDSEREGTPAGSKTIDFSYLTNNSSFQRAIMEFIRKFVPGLEDLKVRGNKEVMKQSFNENANNYRNVMKELKEVLKKRNE